MTTLLLQTTLGRFAGIVPATVAIFLFSSGIITAQSLSVTIEWQAVSCAGGQDGVATAVVTGGAQPYAYQWANAAGFSLGTASQIQHLSAGSYTVTVADLNFNAVVQTVTITQPPTLGVTTFAQSQICAVAPDGAATAVPFGGTPPYSYQWSNGGNTAMITNIAAGTYTVTIVDAHLCTQTSTVTVLNFGNEGIWSSITSQPATCPSLTGGSLSVMPMSGTPPYQYTWSTGETDADIFSLNPGTYTVTITDTNGCAAVAEETVILNPLTFDSFVLYTEDFCQDIPFELSAADSLYYDLYNWSSTDPGDTFTPGTQTPAVTVHWSAPGPRTVTVVKSSSFSPCTSAASWQVNIKSCSTSTGEQTDRAVTVSPNPFFTDLTVRLQKQPVIPIEYSLTDVTGTVVAAGKLNAEIQTLETALLPPGVYFLKIDTEKPSILKVIKL